MMTPLVPCDAPFALDDLTALIRASSNFRFNWQFFQSNGIDLGSTVGARRALDAILTNPDLHRFLRESFDDSGGHASFGIGPLHEHCRIEPAPDEFESILAGAAANRLGAYSPDLRPATEGERRNVRSLFEQAGRFVAFATRPGNVLECPTCREHGGLLFSTWFYGVAWDWCLLAAWPDRELLWMGCLTDTD